MEGITEPVAPGTERMLRRAVLDHALAERRRLHAPVLHVGRPSGLPRGRESVFPVRHDEPTDHGLRSDIVAAMVKRTRHGDVPLVWLTRAGALDVQDVDVQWLGAARTAYGEAGLELCLVVVNRHGWRDPRTGVERTWVRLRRR